MRVVSQKQTVRELSARMGERTLQLTGPRRSTLGLAAVLFALLLVLGEAVVRTDVFRAHVVSTSKGGRHDQFEHQLGRLEAVVAKDGPIDCIVLGNSMVWFGFDTEAFAQGYLRQANQHVRCYNFGVVAMPAAAAGAVAPILVGDYQPNLLIYGTSAQDYAISRATEDATVIMDMPWLKYRLGQFSIQGWFFASSRTYQYRDTVGRLLRFQDRYLLLAGNYASAKDNYGFVGKEAARQPVSVPPDPRSEETSDKYLYQLLSGYEMLPENLVGLEQVMALNGPNLQVLIVEMPRPPMSLYFFGDGERDQQRFIDQVHGMAESRGIPFWQTSQPPLIPQEGWWDYSHLNTVGARVFGEWLGEQVGNAVVQRMFRKPVRER